MMELELKERSVVEGLMELRGAYRRGGDGQWLGAAPLSVSKFALFGC